MPTHHHHFVSEAKRGTARPAAYTSAATRFIYALISYWRAFQEQRQRENVRMALRDLSDRELTDIGVTPAEIEYIAAYRAHDTLRDNSRNLGMHSGT
ncbi:DUF1127 domain-containing protein [Tardiphaga alba]|uniref:DUF1127 domain-containing protein n=1 Tax=Tardiphaga alba TaxID=340268 RepID=A0ABX8AE59_9BRAD|nr:DUF1127 domain-containing protein [Tardiphaga alba]QUS40100.1 DUF1127 domain-containing protein [Tardiphaga alba]